MPLLPDPARAHRRARLGLLLSAALASGPGPVGAAPPAGHAYEASLAQRALTGGRFLLGEQAWACMGTLLHCEGGLASPVPTVADCQALVRRVGAVTAFGRVGGPSLRADALIACNAAARAQPPAALPPRGSGAANRSGEHPAALAHRILPPASARLALSAPACRLREQAGATGAGHHGIGDDPGQENDHA